MRESLPFKLSVCPFEINERNDFLCYTAVEAETYLCRNIFFLNRNIHIKRTQPYFFSNTFLIAKKN